MAKKDVKDFDVTVTRVKEFKKKGEPRAVAYDLEVNGVKIYGMWQREGKKGAFHCFPSRKGDDGEYYNHAWFPISKELAAEIDEQIESLL